MKDTIARKYYMFVDVQGFGVARKSDFAVDSRAAELFRILDEIINQLIESDKKQFSGAATSKQGTTSKRTLRTQLYNNLKMISRTAKAIDITKPGIADKFRLPRNGSMQDLMGAGRAFAENAEQMAVEFTSREAPADFIQILKDNLRAIEQANSDGQYGKRTKVAATANLSAIVERGIDTVKELDAIIRNKYRDDAGVLAEWISASHVKQSPVSDPTKKKPPQQPPVG